MKINEILNVIAQDLGTDDLAELNQRLKTEDSQKIKYKILGKKLGQLGYTVAIKKITTEGLKIFEVNRVSLVKFVDIESFEKAKPRVKRPKRSSKVVKPAKIS